MTTKTILDIKPRLFMLVALIWIASSCYSTPEIPGFNTKKWLAFNEDCSDYRLIEGSELILEHEELLLSYGQNEITNTLGPPSRHELFNRNQKFFFYDLDCLEKETLRFRFDALGRLKEIDRINR